MPSRLRYRSVLIFLAASAAFAQTPSAPPPPSLSLYASQPNSLLGAAYASAITDLLEINTVPYGPGEAEGHYNQTGLLSRSPDTFLRAGGGYHQPWTRDASVNSWNAGSLLEPAVARNTLYSVLRRQSDGKLIIQQDNQWWDQVIWITSAWNHFNVTGDRTFLNNAYQAATQTLTKAEGAHFNHEVGLFQGPAFLNDGIAGYPTPPADSKESHGSFVLDYPGSDQIMVLSTNCLYAHAYQVAALMAGALGRPTAEAKGLKMHGETLANTIRQRFWLREQGRFGYLIQPTGVLDTSQEGAGLAFSILFEIATPEQAASILRTTHIDPHGIVDVYPAFPRFSAEQPGRHNEILWPPIQAFWADAAARSHQIAPFQSETENLANLVSSNGGHFWEIYNAESGKPDGGWQVGHQWDSQPDQTWSATGFLRMIYAGLFGMRFDEGKLTFAPCLPESWGTATLSGLHYRNAVLTVELHGAGTTVKTVAIDGKKQARPEIAANLTGAHTIRIDMTQ